MVRMLESEMGEYDWLSKLAVQNMKILKDIISRKYAIKKELKLIILKSIIHNQNILPKEKLYALLHLTINSKKK